MVDISGCCTRITGVETLDVETVCDNAIGHKQKSEICFACTLIHTNKTSTMNLMQK